MTQLAPLTEVFGKIGGVTDPLPNSPGPGARRRAGRRPGSSPRARKILEVARLARHVLDFDALTAAPSEELTEALGATLQHTCTSPLTMTEPHAAGPTASVATSS